MHIRLRICEVAIQTANDRHGFVFHYSVKEFLSLVDPDSLALFLQLQSGNSFREISHCDQRPDRPNGQDLFVC
jgi:hypothetical protein